MSRDSGSRPDGTHQDEQVLELETERVGAPLPGAQPPPGQGGVNLPQRSANRRRAAWAVALFADFLQWIALPFFAPGVLSPFNNGLDLLVAALLIRLLGWHWAFLPTFVAELVPGLDLVPTWTAAVWLATRGAARK
ncbi:MAG: hypothetical protein HOP12_07955 [Candidatus Eisenbacteria bacterium]|uniref:Uncharacterized protein n=1 Tax=Eiseniibacteriota bacterium TaxID=2212470 RepID=A0A849SEE0_UNCEI|nr:hypothetical protein [Candidatus Eisenbacteria bacterium]